MPFSRERALRAVEAWIARVHGDRAFYGSLRIVVQAGRVERINVEQSTVGGHEQAILDNETMFNRYFGGGD